MGDRFSELSELTTIPLDIDFLAIVDTTGTDETKNIKIPLFLKKSTRPIIVALTDEDTVLPTASDTVPLVTFRMPYKMKLLEVRASLTVAGTGAALVTVDIHESGTTVLSTKITIDAGEKTSTTAVTDSVISDDSLADDAEIQVFLDVLDTDNVATGLKVMLIGYEDI